MQINNFPLLRIAIKVLILVAITDSITRAQAETPPQSAAAFMQTVHATLQKDAAERVSNNTNGLDGLQRDIRNQAMAKASFYQLCKDYSKFETLFDVSAPKVEGWNEVQKIALQLYAYLDKIPPQAHQKIQSCQKAWMLILAAKYDEALEFIAKAPAALDFAALEYDSLGKLDNNLLIRAKLCAHASKGDYTGAATAAAAALSQGTDDGELYLLSARIMAKSGDANGAREQCQIIVDIFPNSPEEKTAREIAKQYNLKLESPDLKSIINKYIYNSKKGAWLITGIAALGTHKFPGAFEYLEKFYNEKGEGIKKSALQGLGNLADEKSTAFLLQIALAEPKRSQRSFFPQYDTIPQYAFAILCTTNNKQAVLQFIKHAQNNARLRAYMDGTSSFLKKIFNGGPDPVDPTRPYYITAKQWINWLRQTGQIENFPAEEQPVLSFAEADRRRNTDVWLFMQFNIVNKNTEVLKQLDALCEKIGKIIESSAKSVSPEKTTSQLMLPLGLDEMLLPSQFQTAARQLEQINLLAPDWFSNDDKTRYSSRFSQAKALCTGMRECAKTLHGLALHKMPASEILPVLKQIQSKTKELVALRQTLFTDEEIKQRVDILEYDASELLRAAGLEKHAKNMQRISDLLGSLIGMLSPMNRSGQKYKEARLNRIKSICEQYNTETTSLKNIFIKNESAEYYKACRKILNDIEPLIKDANTVKRSDDIIRAFFNRRHELDDRAQCFLKLSVAATRDEQGIAMASMAVSNSYECVNGIKERAAAMQKYFGEYMKFLDQGALIQYDITLLLKDTDKWVAGKKSAGMYDKMETRRLPKTDPLPFNGQVLQAYMSGEDINLVNTLRAKWDEIRMSVKMQLTEMKNILDSENYNNDNGSAYKKVSDQLNASAKVSAEFFRTANSEAKLQLLHIVRKMSVDGGAAFPAMIPILDANIATAALLIKMETSGDIFTGSNEKVSPAINAKRKKQIAQCRSQLEKAMAAGESLDTNRWDNAWKSFRDNWLITVKSVIFDMDQAMQIPNDADADTILSIIQLHQDAELLKVAPVNFGTLLNPPAQVPYEDSDMDE